VLRNDVAVDALAFLGEPLDERSAVGDLTLRFGKRLALLGRQQQSQVVLVRHHQVEPPAQQRGALLRGLRAPGGPGPVCGFYRTPRFGGAHAGHGTDGFTRRGIVYRDGLVCIGADPGAVQVALLAEKFRVLERERGQARLLGCVHRILRSDAGRRASHFTPARLLPSH
jgi:ParB family chromosome partitioning protein